MLPSLSLHPALAAGNWEVTRSLSFILVCRDFCLSFPLLLYGILCLTKDTLSSSSCSSCWELYGYSLSLPLPLILWTFCRCLFYFPMSFPFEVSELLITWQHSLLSLSLSHTCCHACHLLRVKFECTYHKVWWCTLCAYFMYIDIRWSHRSVPVPEIAGSNPHRCLNSFHW